MARKKQYVKEDVVDKAMNVFWQNGYENTSMQLLEKEMGINKFSIYASFGSKQGVFIASLNSYKRKVNHIFDKLENSTKGIEGIKEFFYDSVGICHLEGSHKGCLLTNTYNEFSGNKDEVVKSQMELFMNNLKNIFIKKLRADVTKNEDTIQKQANFLVLAKHGLAAASRVNSDQEITDYIEITFSTI